MLYSPFAIAAPLPEVQEFIYTAGSNGTTRKFDANTGELMLSVNHGTTLNGIAVDVDGNFYTGGGVTSAGPGTDTTTRKYNSDGNLIWTRVHGSQVNAIATRSDGSVYVAGRLPDSGSGITLRKYNSAGTLIWSINGFSSKNINDVANNGSRVAVAGGTPGATYTIRTDFGTSPSSSASGASAGTVKRIALDQNLNRYTGGIRTSSVTTRKFNSSNQLELSIDHGANVESIAVDNDGNIYTGGTRTDVIGGQFATTRKYDSGGNLLLSVDHGATVRGIAVDKKGNFYTGGISTSTGPGTSISLRKYDSNGTLLFSINAGTSNEIATFPPNVGDFLS